ncbi:hypothetical protein [Nonomuraea jabiensis]|uniref:hypothetical protein n=1 Tax=Nonomuraea jabiensis TaxID=882448 RepID=UPI0036A0E933
MRRAVGGGAAQQAVAGGGELVEQFVRGQGAELGGGEVEGEREVFEPAADGRAEVGERRAVPQLRGLAQQRGGRLRRSICGVCRFRDSCPVPEESQ